MRDQLLSGATQSDLNKCLTSKTLWKGIKKGYDKSDPLLSALVTGLEIFGAMGFISSSCYFSYTMCKLGTLKNPDPHLFAREYSLAHIIFGVLSGAVLLADVLGGHYGLVDRCFNYVRRDLPPLSNKDWSLYKAFWINRIKAGLMGAFAGGVLSDQALIGLLGVESCTALVTTNTIFSVLLGGLRFWRFTNTNPPIQYISYLKNENTYEALIQELSSTGKIAQKIKIAANVAVSGATGLALYHSFWGLVQHENLPKYGRDYGKLATGFATALLGFCFSGVFVSTLNKKYPSRGFTREYPELCYRWKQLITTLSTATLIERALDTMYGFYNDDNPTSPWYPIFNVASILLAVSRANRELPLPMSIEISDESAAVLSDTTTQPHYGGAPEEDSAVAPNKAFC